MMLKIIDLTLGETIISDLEEEFVETQLLKYITAEYEEDLPEYFWLSTEALEGILSQDNNNEEEDTETEEDIDEEDEELDIRPVYLTKKDISDELRRVMERLLDYIQNNSEFIDSDDDDMLDPNEKGCYMALEYIEELPEYKVYGKVKRGDASPPGLRLQLYDDELINDDFVGFGFTDFEGNYSIEFKRENFTEDPLDFKGTPNLYINVSEFDKIKSEFKFLKKVKIPETDDKKILFDINL